MNRLLDMNSPMMQFLSRMGDVILLNLLTLLCSIPIVTVGAAVTALHVALDKLKKDEGRLFPNFFNAFKANFLQSTALWLILVFFGAISAFGIFSYTFGYRPEGMNVSAPLIVCLIFFVLWLFTLSWTFPLQARFSNTVFGTLKNALICSIAFFPRTLVIVIINVLPFLLLTGNSAIFLTAMILWVMLYFGIGAWLITSLLRVPFQKLAPELELENLP